MKKFLITGIFGGLLALLALCPAYAYNDVRPDVLHDVLSGDATGDGKIIYIDRFSTIGVSVQLSGTATVTFRGAVDGVNFVDWVCTKMSATPTTASTASVSGSYICPVAGLQAFKAQVTSWTSGTVVVKSISSTGPAPGGAQAFTVDSNGNLNVVFRNCFSGESICIATSPNSYMMTNGANPRVLQLVGTGGVPTTASNATYGPFELAIGDKTFHGVETCTGTCAQVQTIYGTSLNNTTVGTSMVLCTITLNNSAAATQACTITTNWKYTFVVTSGTGGTTPLASLIVQY